MGGSFADWADVGDVGDVETSYWILLDAFNGFFLFVQAHG